MKRLPRCARLRCKRRPYVRDVCRTHAIAAMDELARSLVRVRDPHCRAHDYSACNMFGGLQWAHLVSRQYHAARWRIDGAVMLCAGHHTYFTHHPLDWDLWCEDTFGTEWWTTFKHEAKREVRHAEDLEAIWQELEGSRSGVFA